MCQHRTYIAVLNTDDTITIHALDGSDSHQKIRDHYHIRDGDVATSRQAPLEIVPGDLRDPSTWVLCHDGCIPDWWTENMTEQVMARLCRDHTQYWNPETRSYWFPSDLDLGSLVSLPDGVSLTAGGDLNLRSLVSLPEGVSLSAGGDLYLSSITRLPDGIAKGVRGRIYLAGGTVMSGTRQQ